MSKRLDEIKVEKVLELFAPNILKVVKWDELDMRSTKEGRDIEYVPNFEPSLTEQVELVNLLKNKFVFDGKTLTLYGDGKSVEFIPSFNFFLLSFARASHEAYTQKLILATDLEIRILGFTYFSELKTFVENSNGALGESFFIIVKDFDSYKEVIYRFALIDYKGNKTYVNHQVFYLPTDRAIYLGIKDPSLLYSFEIPFLCEIYEQEIVEDDSEEIDEDHIEYIVGLFTSEVDIRDNLSCTLGTNPLKKAIARKGTILYDNKEYVYFASYKDGRRVMNMKERIPQEIIDRTL